MNMNILKAVDRVCRDYSDIALRISDIIECKDTYNSLILHCKNDCGMFEFIIVATEETLNTYTNEKCYEVRFSEVENSPYSCDNCTIILDSSYNLIAN